MTLDDRVRTVLLLAATGLLVQLPTAQAQSAEAEVLFREGRKLIKQGKIAAGCDKLAASERLEPSIGTLLNLGDCREKLGKLASAWATFRKAEGMAKRSGGDDRRKAEAKKRAAQLEPNLANLVIQVDLQLDGLNVKRDGLPIERGAWNTAVPVDPGSYAIVVEAPGHKPWRTEVTVLHKSKRVVVVPTLERVFVRPPAPAVEPASALVAQSLVTQPRARVAMRMRTSEPSSFTAERKLGVVLGVVGAGAIGAGIYYGMQASDLSGDADARCPLLVCSDPEGLRLNNRAQSAATRANIFYVAGGISVATAVVLFIVGGPEQRTVVTPNVGSDQVGVSVAGSF
jgi:hypothetical protein